MAKSTDNPGKKSERKVKAAIIDYVKTLSQEQKMLVVLKEQLYNGRWEPMLDDLQNRLAGQPYIFKLASRIQDDISRIQELQNFEQQNQINLADFVEIS
jgi:hypothetical protein